MKSMIGWENLTLIAHVLMRDGWMDGKMDPVTKLAVVDGIACIESTFLVIFVLYL